MYLPIIRSVNIVDSSSSTMAIMASTTIMIPISRMALQISIAFMG